MPNLSTRTLVHELVPLRQAALLVWQRIYASDEPLSAAKEEMLDAIASTFARVGPVYAFDANPDPLPREIGRDELEEGIFRGGANELRFPDERPPKRLLAVATEDVTATIQALKEAGL
jgi:hypothetical protein